MRPDALPGQRFLSESWNDMQVGMGEFLAANVPAVPTNVVSAIGAFTNPLEMLS
jgi:hypothetical protein